MNPGLRTPSIALLLLLVSVSLAPALQLPSARLDSLLPSGAAPGSSTEVTVTGADLDELSELRFEHPGIVAAPKRDENGTVVAGRFVVAVDAAVPAGFYDVRALGRFGLSNPRRFVVDRLPTVVASGNHRSRETAQTIAVGSAVDGRIDPNQRDYYKLELAAGETIVAEAIAAPLDSRAVPTIEVLDLDGRELTRFRGVPERSTVGSFVAPSGGVYLIGVRDLIFGGGAEHFYRLRVHRGPIVERFAPAVVPADGKVAIEVIGFGLGEGATPLEGDPAGRTRRTIELDVPAALAAADRTGRDLLPIAALDEVRVVPLDVVGPDGVTEVLPITVAGGAIVAETESEDEWSSQPTAQSLALPCTVDGRFGEPRDRDWFEFTAKAGENWMIEVLADRLGMPSDPLIAVHRVDTAADGSRTYAQIALADDPGDRAGLIGVDFDLTSDDPSLVFTAPADGTYRLSIDDLFGGTRNDPGVRYLLRVRPLEPRVRLVVQPALGRPGNDQQAVLGTYEVRRGGTERIGVLIHRLEGNAAPIELSIEGLPAGLSCDPVRVEPYVGATQLVIRAADDAAPWSGTVRIIGRWQQGDQARETTALVGTLAYGTDNRAVRTAQSRLTDALHLATVSAETEPVALQPSTLRVVGSRGARIELPLSLVRRNGFDGAVTFNPIVSHGELKVAPIAFEAGKGDGVIVLDMASANLPAGVHQLVLQGDVTFKYVRFPEQIAAAEATVNGIQARQAALTAEREQLTATLANFPAQRETIGGDERLASAALARADAALLDGARRLVAAHESLDGARASLAEAPEDAPRIAAVNDSAAMLAAATASVQAAAAARRIAADATDAARIAIEKIAVDEAAAQTRLAEIDAAVAALATELQTATAALEATRNANQPADRVYTAVAPQIEVVVESAPFGLSATGSSIPVGAGGSVGLDLERRYGFAGPVTITVSAPSIPGLSITGGELAADATHLDLAVATTAETPVGPIELTITATSKFNELDVTGSTTASITIVSGN